MENKTKIKLSCNDIQRLVNQAFGNMPLLSVRELTDGYFNTAYHVTLGNGELQTVLKVGPPAEADILTYEKGLLHAEVETMKLVGTDPEIPVPRIIFDDFSRTWLPCDYYFMDFIDGTPWRKNNIKQHRPQLVACHLSLARCRGFSKVGCWGRSVILANAGIHLCTQGNGCPPARA
jgi:hypothetical protein